MSLTTLKTLSHLYRLRALGERYFVSAAYTPPIDVSEGNIAACYLCALSKRRTHSLIGIGEMRRKIMIVLDEPSNAEDESGKWLSGASGLLLQNMIEKGMKLSIDDVYITSAIKCHSFGILDDNYLNICRCYLINEINRLQPTVILALGQKAFGILCANDEKLQAARGRAWQCALSERKCVVIPSFSLGYLRTNVSAKREAFMDLLHVIKIAS